MNPINTAIQIFKEISSFKKIKENNTTTIGVRAPILWASARLRYLNAKIKHPDSSKDNKLLRSCSFQLLVK